MLKLKTEREFYKSLGKSMQKLRKKLDASPYYTGRLLGINGVLYYCMEKGDVAPTPYLLYLLMFYAQPELIQNGKWPYRD